VPYNSSTIKHIKQYCQKLIKTMVNEKSESSDVSGMCLYTLKYVILMVDLDLDGRVHHISGDTVL